MRVGAGLHAPGGRNARHAIGLGPVEGAWRLTNGTVEVVVVPEIGRIVRYGYVGGPNVLWNGDVSAELARTKGWRNFGGDKVWPWPENAWKDRTDRSWPPPDGCERDFEVHLIGKRALRMTGPEVTGYGLRVVREIALDETGTRVTVTSRFLHLGEGPKCPAAVWSVTQVPAPTRVLARLTSAGAGAVPFKVFGKGPWQSVGRLRENLAVIERPETKSAKIGLDADALACRIGDVLFVQVLVQGGVGTRKPLEQAQLYCQSKPAYVELELTSARGADAMTVVWRLQRTRTASTDALADAVLRLAAKEKP